MLLEKGSTDSRGSQTAADCGSNRFPRPVLVLVGPTATGKTAVALEIAEEWGRAPIISADSMQVYQGMDIGTAKPTAKDRERVPHYMLDVVEPTVRYSVADYRAEAEPRLSAFVESSQPVIVSGGTGHYVRALIDGICDSPPASLAFRAAMHARAEQVGREALHRELEAVDPEAAAGIHPNNLRRTIRALEVYHLTGRTVTTYRREQPPSPWKERSVFVGLRRPWREVDRRIETRTDEMFSAGLVQEVRGLFAQGCNESHTAMQGIGYREIVDHLKGNCSLKQARDRIVQSTRRLARRQMTWWRPDLRVRWLLIKETETTRESALRVQAVWRAGQSAPQEGT